MLIDSPRITSRDRKAWDNLQRYDQLLATRLPLDELETQAVKTIEEFAALGGCYAGTSWGKDSTVLAHLVAISKTEVPLIWVRVENWENPDCEAVRDAFLEKHPHMRARYEEIEVEAAAPRWWENGAEDNTSKRTSRGGFTIARKKYGARHISGVRAEESRQRRLVQQHWGAASKGACRPIGWWTGVDVFAYLESRSLPVHPAYAMSIGGALDRRNLRVSSLGGGRGNGHGRAEWEARYYPDVISQQAN